jgi:diaminopimelate decarboxylase
MNKIKKRKNSLVIYISGLYSGPNPSPGVGIARSLRQAYPHAILIGVDYSPRSSGIHWHDFDEIWLQRPWDELDLEEYAFQIQNLLDSGAFWISGLDLETIWLANTLSKHPNLLIPPKEALQQTAKPEIQAHRDLPVQLPPYLRVSAHPDDEIHEFCRKYGWKVWIKGPYYEAYRVQTWMEFKRMCALLSNTWATDDLFLQAHVVGYEESIAFCAYNGDLLGCVYMNKRDITPEGKTWAGQISDVPAEILAPLQRIVKRLRWTGGAELELIRELDGKLWLIEWNPRFPAWIYGATLTGHNLPALLVERASGISGKPTQRMAKQFARIVIEVPVRSGFPLAPLSEPAAHFFGSSTKHPSGMPVLASRLKQGRIQRRRSPKLTKSFSEYDAQMIFEEIQKHNFNNIDTPHRIFLENISSYLFKRSAEAIAGASARGVPAVIAYSVKTNPDIRFLKLALEHGFLAEVISKFEIKKALSAGFNAHKMVLNGPGKWWPSYLDIDPTSSFYAIFCDSIDELERLINDSILVSNISAKFIGIRIRPPWISSRFGIEVDDPTSFKKLIKLRKKIDNLCLFGLHFHIPSHHIGIERWMNLYKSILGWAKAFEKASGIPVGCIDIGGGWFPKDWIQVMLPSLEELLNTASANLSNLNCLILEPGRALVQSSMALVVRILEVRKSGSNIKEIVVDGSIAELPDIHNYPHRVIYRSKSGDFALIGRGECRVLGRTCMEDDVLFDNLELPSITQADDFLIICDSGAYDRSMSYEFGK